MSERAASAVPLALEFRNLSKTFGGQKALSGVDFHLRPGEVHGLLGQNGSGKSTLIKVLAGYHAPDPGSELFVNGERVPLPLPSGRFRALGISFVHQHLGLIPSLTVVENLLLGRMAASRALALSWSREAARARRVFERYGLTLDPNAQVSRLTGVERALLAIVRAMEEMRGIGQTRGGVLVLDEPTPFLPKRDVDRLFALIRAIVADGASVIFVSHDVDEVLEITDRATVLRDGHVAGTITTRGTSKDDLVRLIVGRALVPTARKRSASGVAAPLAVVKGLTGPFINQLSFWVGQGEILGVTGLLGSGYEQVPYLLYGATRPSAGSLTVEGRQHDLLGLTPAEAVSNGIVLIPGDRAAAGVIGALPVVDNVTMPALGTIFHPLALARRRMVLLAAELGRRFEVTPNRPTLPVSALSGGNAQKVVLAKWLQGRPRLILLDEPTQGVDVGARYKVFEAIRDAAADGAGVLCASSDYEQLASICDRVLILARGRVAAELARGDLSKESIAERCYRAGTVSAQMAEAET
jgi:ribose transport system ATP-binding protein